VAPRLIPLLSLAAVVAEVSGVGLAAQIAHLVNLLVVVDLPLLWVGDQLKTRVKDPSETGIDKTQRFAMLVAMMTVEEHRDTCFSEITLSETMLVQAMNLWISEDVPIALKVNNHHVTLSELP
jgi:hypothetical protein